MVCAVLAGGADHRLLVLYALRANIDLFYTPAKSSQQARDAAAAAADQRLRVGRMVMPGSVRRGRTRW
ncbi:cytochrome c maturation protein CcmE [Salmonella enterica]|uniref:cytochrome c maturation protein CcmE domain-containing protein n=1 Tax=Salmonella enterica TaxID=28901 RepID=UPI003D7C33DC